jgi:hypothetical protein
MSRTSIEVAFNGKSVDDILKIFESEMIKNKYENQIIKGENVWAKGDGVLLLRQCFSVSFTESTVILQGWTGDALLGESELKGFMGSAVKKKMRAIMDSIVNKI